MSDEYTVSAITKRPTQLNMEAQDGDVVATEAYLEHIEEVADTAVAGLAEVEYVLRSIVGRVADGAIGRALLIIDATLNAIEKSGYES